MPPRNKPYNNKLNSDKKLPPKAAAASGGGAKLQHPTTTHTAAAAAAPQSDSYFPNLDNHNLIFSYNVLSTNLRASAISLYKLTTDIVTTLTTYASHARVFVQLKFKQAYPVLMRWSLYFANVILLLLMVWLDCALRGIDSFLRMGTTSFFSVIWCTVLSLLAMIGIFKFLLFLVIPTLLGIFVGFTFSLMAVAILGVVLLGLYGSFWTTMSVIFIGGVAFAFSHERLALFITTLYSVYCAWTYVGWLGLLLGLNLSFISSDALIYFLKNNVNERTRPTSSSEQTDEMRGRQGFFPGEYVHVPSSETDTAADRSSGAPSTSGFDSDITSEDEVVRLLNCTDHYSALGLSRFENIDVSLLKREYRKKAMLVHPDKNMGNEKAAEAFKKLQNAYEILLDSLKRGSYDDELKREELLNYFRRFQGASQKNGQHAFYPSGFTRPDNEDPFGESKRIVCKKCGNSHLWIYTKKAKARARWCQDCKNFHPAKDGDGWVEQSVQPFFFGMMQKVEAPTAYICAESKIYDATEWYICRGMRCPANSHKPSFHVNTNVTTSKHNSSGKGSSSGHKNGEMEDGMTEEEFFEWLQNAMQTGTIPPFSATTDNASAPPGNNPKTSAANASGSAASKRKKKGKKSQ